MVRIPVLISVFILCGGMIQHGGFKEDQLEKSRVKAAYDLKEDELKLAVQELGIDYGSMSLFIRAFKEEGELEVFVSDSTREDYVLLKTYDFCMLSGVLGPKRKQGDYQVPEGFYYIDRFNPYSSFHLSLGINYPNDSDRILSNASDPGGDIFIHGNCVTIGCIPITDDKIKELYLLAVEAKDSGQDHIPVHIFPFRLSADKLEAMRIQYSDEPDLITFWENLQDGYVLFEHENRLPEILVDPDNGRYVCSPE